MRAPPGTIALADAMKRASGRGRSDNGAGAAEPLPKLVPIRFVEGEAVQPRGWIVHGGYIPTRTTTLIQGNGGDGKTSLAQQLQSSCATALPWIGLRVEECVSVGFYSEDEEQDIKERQAAIDAAYGQNCVSTGKMYLFSRADEDSELVVFDRARRPSPTNFYWQAREAAMDLRARLVEFDVAVDLFGGDENKRTEVRAFIRPLTLWRGKSTARSSSQATSRRLVSKAMALTAKHRLVERRPHPTLFQSTEGEQGRRRLTPTTAFSRVRSRTTPAPATRSDCVGRTV